MLVLLFIIAVICFVASILPFVFPGTLLSSLGVALNHWAGEFLASTFSLGPGTLVARTSGVGTVPGGLALTWEGVLVVYVPLIAVLLFIMRGR